MIKLPTATAYTAEEVGKMINRKTDTVRKYVRSGKLKGQKVGNEWYVTDRALTEFITGEKPEPRPRDDSKR